MDSCPFVQKRKSCHARIPVIHGIPVIHDIPVIHGIPVTHPAILSRQCGMNKKPEYKACRTYDLSIPHWDHHDYSGKPVVTSFAQLQGVFKSWCSRFIFYPHCHWEFNDPKSKSGVTFRARIILKVKKTPGTVRTILKERGIMSTVTVVPTKREKRAKDDGFYVVRDGVPTKLLGPDWVDDTKKKNDKKAEEAKEAKRAKEIERAKKKAKTEEEEMHRRPEMPEMPKYDPGAWAWAPHFILAIDAQMPCVIDVMVVAEVNDQITASRYVTNLRFQGCHCYTRQHREIKDLKDAINKNGGVEDRGMPHVFDMADMRQGLIFKKHETEFDDEAVWDIIVNVKKGEFEGWEPSDIKNRVLVFTDKEPPTKVYPGITIRRWLMTRSGHGYVNPGVEECPPGSGLWRVNMGS